MGPRHQRRGFGVAEEAAEPLLPFDGAEVAHGLPRHEHGEGGDEAGGKGLDHTLTA